MSSLNKTADLPIASRCRHDLLGPINNILGFSKELREAIDDLVVHLRKHESAMPAEFVEYSENVIENDLQPCMGFLEHAVAQMEQRVEHFSHEYAELAPKQATEKDSS